MIFADGLLVVVLCGGVADWAGLGVDGVGFANELLAGSVLA